MDKFLILLLEKKEELAGLFIQHMNMTAIAVFISLLIGVPLGILVTKNKKAASLVIGFANVLQSIPSIALLAFAVPFVGIGEKPAILMVIVYSLLPILKNTYTGIMGIDPKMLEVARGLGMSMWQRLTKIELPLTARYIMSGIRISAVAAVGTMTIAAFAGAGGLGWYINLGLNSQDVNLVLLGAIPASLLALFFDYMLGRLEKVITPEGLLPPNEIKSPNQSKRRCERFTVITLCLAIVLVPLGMSGYKMYEEQHQKLVVVGSSNFTESLILGAILANAIEQNTDIKVKRSFNLGGAVMAFGAMKADELDVFPTYLGTIMPNFLHEPMPSHDPDQVFSTAKRLLEERYKISLADPIGFNNTYVMAVRPEIAAKYGLKTVADLMKVAPQLRLGCTVEFVHRADGLQGLQSHYGTQFGKVRGLDGSIRYAAIAAGEVDVIDAFSTDALLEKQKLVLLEDRDQFFPPYYASFIYREAWIGEYPELKPIMDKLSGSLNDREMRQLNLKVDLEGQDAEQVAQDFLRSRGLMR